MNGSSNHIFDARDNKINCPKCRLACEVEYNISTSQKNFLISYFACMNCNGFLFWAKEDEVREGTKLSQTNPSANSKGRQFTVGVDCYGHKLIIKLRDQMISIANKRL